MVEGKTAITLFPPLGGLYKDFPFTEDDTRRHFPYLSRTFIEKYWQTKTKKSRRRKKYCIEGNAVEYTKDTKI
jgi:hypothetical protein